MTQTVAEPKLYSFDEFISQYPENSLIRYELHDGVIIELPKPKGKHSNLTGSLIEQLFIVIQQMSNGGIWTIPRESIIKPRSERSGYEPDIIVLDRNVIEREFRWETESYQIRKLTVIKNLGSETLPLNLHPRVLVVRASCPLVIPINRI